MLPEAQGSVMSIFLKLLTFLIGFVWFANGLWAKVLNLTPRHQSIVETILGAEHGRQLTVLIGVGEICLAIAIWLRLWPLWLGALQIVLVLTMNLLELSRAKEFLLWGQWNFVYATLFCLAVAFHAWSLHVQRK